MAWQRAQARKEASPVSHVRCPIVELRQYTLHDGQRDALIDLFDRELVESQEAAGMTLIGQFRDLDDPNRFVWLRGFTDMPSRAEALRAFYGGPMWKAHARQANATMIDSDNVLLLRPADERSGFPAPTTARPPAGHPVAPRSVVIATLYYRDQPFDKAFADFFDRSVRPVITDAGAAPLACLQTEHAENTFPSLPVREGENVFAWFARFSGQFEVAIHQRALERSPAWRDAVLPELSAAISGQPQRLRLTPTARSLLR
jgi:quinol monooxygenase YgiN